MNNLQARALAEGLSAQQLFDGAADRDLVKLIERARDTAAVLPGTALAVALHKHLADALILAEQLKAGRS